LYESPKERFDAASRVYDDTENPALEEADSAMNFLASLDDARYLGFKSYVLNGVAAGASAIPVSVNDVQMKGAFLPETSKGKGVSGSSFATAHSSLRGKGHGKARSSRQPGSKFG
jgi:hypothetical protein